MTDVVVVGAGTAGCILAARLAAAGYSITLIEAGPDYGPSRQSWPPELLRGASLPTTHDWGYSGDTFGGRSLPYDRAKVMGGCSSHNGCTQSLGWGADYDSWPSVDGVGWSAAELAPLFARVAEQMSFQTYEPESVQPFHRAFLTACHQSGLVSADDFADLGGVEGAGCPPVNMVEGVRMNTSLTYVDPVRSLPNLTIISDAEVNRVLLDHGRVTAVEYVKGTTTSVISADEVVISAGAYGTPAILQRSGIGDPQLLSQAGVETRVALPGVGKNLHDHPAAIIELSATPRLAALLQEFEADHFLPEEQSVAKVRSPQARGPYDLHLYPWIERDANDLWTCVFPVGLLTPLSRGTVSISSADVLSPPVIDSGFFSDPNGVDLAAVRWGLQLTAELIRSQAFSGLLGPAISAPPQGASDDQIDTWIRSSHSHYWHPAGSCQMGDPEDPLSVVDYAGRVAGVESLRIADASIFPQIPRSTPAWPTAMVGERIAELMLAGV